MALLKELLFGYAVTFRVEVFRLNRNFSAFTDDEPRRSLSTLKEWLTFSNSASVATTGSHKNNGRVHPQIQTRIHGVFRKQRWSQHTHHTTTLAHWWITPTSKHVAVFTFRCVLYHHFFPNRFTPGADSPGVLQQRHQLRLLQKDVVDCTSSDPAINKEKSWP